MALDKRLVILDLDNTLVDTLRVWGESTCSLIENFSAQRNVKVEIIHDLIREAHGQHRFNDGVSLVDWMNAADPQLQEPGDVSLRKAWEIANAGIKRAWLDQSAALTVFYDGVLDSLTAWKTTKTGTVIQTDAEDSAVIRRLWLLGKNAAEAGHLSHPRDILRLIDAVYCQPGIEHSPLFLADVDFSFISGIRQKMHLWTDRLYKPSHIHLRKILDDFRLSAEEAIYIGDTHKDGAEAKGIAPAVDFAWARYGTPVSQETLSLYSKVGSRSYSYGEDVIQKEMSDRGVRPDIILNDTLSDVLPRFAWKPARNGYGC
jgi:phosphoglycolate phosphatase-like HAD superfamily hydrolase